MNEPDSAEVANGTYQLVASCPGGQAQLYYNGDPVGNTFAYTPAANFTQNIVLPNAGGGGDPGTVSFEEASSVVPEQGGTRSIQVNRTGGTETASATCTFNNGTATQGADFNPIVTTVTWIDADNTPKSCQYAVVPDDVDEGASEQFTVTLGAGNGNPALGAVTTHIVTITDDDEPGQTPSAGSVSFNTAGQNIGEGTNSGLIAVTRSGGVNTVVSVTCVYTGSGANPATPGTDFTAGVVNLTWTANENGTKNCVFVPIDDLLDEPDETFTATLTITQGNPSTAGQFQSHVVTIIDNDDPGVPGATQTPTATPTQVHPPVPTSTAVPEPTPTITPTATATFAGVPTNTPAGATHTPTNTQVPPSATPTRTNTVPAPMPPNTGTGTASSTDSGMSMLAILALIAVGVTVSGFAAAKVTRK